MSHADAFLSLSSVELRRRIGTKEISPVELVDASIARIEALNPAVNAIAATDFRAARQRDRDAVKWRDDPFNAPTGFVGVKADEEPQSDAATKGQGVKTAVTVVIGLAIYMAFQMGLHRLMTGVEIM